jgi:hypothetical protein
LDILLHHIPPVLPAVPRTPDHLASSTACANTSETLHLAPFADIEEDNTTMTPAAELLLGIGSIFASEGDKVQNSSQVLGQYSRLFKWRDK